MVWLLGRLLNCMMMISMVLFNRFRKRWLVVNVLRKRWLRGTLSILDSVLLRALMVLLSLIISIPCWAVLLQRHIVLGLVLLFLLLVLILIVLPLILTCRLLGFS